MSTSDASPLPPALAGKKARLLAYRVNRRPIGEGTLIPEAMPPEAFDHFCRMLAPGYEVVTSGRGRDRAWRVGGIEIDRDAEFLTGKLGWYPKDPEVVPAWSAELMDWPPTVRPPAETLVPFAFDGTTRLLGVVRDKHSAPATIASVFEEILRDNEHETAMPTTEWSVEPILDSTEFIDWLHSQDVVRSVGFVARLPNPEPKRAFEELSRRLERAHGTEYVTRMSSQREEGLQQIEEDPEFNQAIAMGQEGYARLEGRGRREGKDSVFRQGEQVASEQVPRLPVDWSEARKLLKSLVRDRLSRFLGSDKEDEAA